MQLNPLKEFYDELNRRLETKASWGKNEIKLLMKDVWIDITLKLSEKKDD